MKRHPDVILFQPGELSLHIHIPRIAPSSPRQSIRATESLRLWSLEAMALSIQLV